jgi:ubiquinone/menaquinone biosynthesis C-methylase UbiE
MEELGDFSSVPKWYTKGRRGVPPAVMDHVLALIGENSGTILDIGCGTGISTRQLRDLGLSVIGVDKYPAMINEARTQSQNISYVVAPAEDLPFPDNAFGAVTAFSAFHWFANKKAAGEIRRVLKPGKLFITVNREDKDNFKRRAMDMFMKKLGKQVAYKDIIAEMRATDFKNLNEHRFPDTEAYSPQEALDFLRSSAWWRIVPKEQEVEFSKECKDLIDSSKTADGLVYRELDFLVVSGN